MSDLPPISGKVKLDPSEFKAALSEMNRDIRVLESGFKAAASGMEDWRTSSQGLEARIATLTDQIAVQAGKVELVRKQYEDVAQAQGGNSKAAEELQIKLNNELAALGKMQTELAGDEKALAGMGQAADDAAGDVKNLTEVTDKSQTAMQGLGQLATGLGASLAVGIAAVAGLAAAVYGLGKSITDLVFNTAESSAELYDLSVKTGISTTRLQEMAYIADQVGTSTDTMTGSMTRLIRSMDSAQSKADGDVAKAFRTLGISVTDSSGALRDQETVFSEVIFQLGKVQNESERDALAMQIFGKSAQELNPLIKAGSDEIARLGDEAHTMGAVMSEENVASFAEFQDGLDSLKAGFQGVLASLATGFLPAFQEIASVLKESLANPKVQEGIRQLTAKIGEFAQQIADFIASEEFGTWLQSVIDWLVNDMPKAVSGAVTSWNDDLWPAIKDFAVFLREDFLPVARDVAAFLRDVLPPVIKALGVVLDALAAGWRLQILLIDTFIMPIFRNLEYTIKNVVLPIVEKLKKFWDDIGANLVTGIWDGMKNRYAWFMGQVTSFFTDIIARVKETLGIQSPSTVFAGIGANMAMGLGQGFSQAFADIEGNMSQAVGGMAAGMGQSAGRSGDSYNVTINYPQQSPGGALADIRMLQMLYGEA